MIIIVGPTGVGKSSFAVKVAQKVGGVIINGDVGQLYSFMHIGTARPLTDSDGYYAGVQHFLYGVENSAVQWDSRRYRCAVKGIVDSVKSSGKMPIVVGGSHFYIQSLLYDWPLISERVSIGGQRRYDWDALHAIDPVRASQIHKNDIYRITRALDIWYATGVAPSVMVPFYCPVSPYVFVSLSREQDELYAITRRRIDAMFDEGWIDECKNIQNVSGMQSFIEKKGFIGYQDIFNWIESRDISLEDVKNKIHIKTMQYIKKQKTFLRSFERDIAVREPGNLCLYNLTLCSDDLYLKQLCSLIEKNKDVLYAR